MNRIFLFLFTLFISISSFAIDTSEKQISNNKISVLKASYNNWDNDISVPECRIVGFSFNSEIIQSENIILKSREQWAHCQEGKNGVSCQNLSPGLLHNKDVRIEIYPAPKMYLWEYNKFKVCLKGANFSVKQIKTAYNYNISKSHIGAITLFIAKPAQKIKMDPDINGLSVNSIEYKEDIIIFKLTDKWSKYYTGKTEINVSLFKENFWLLKDSYIGKYSATEFPNNEYTVTLSKEITGDLKSGNYYFQWSFRRLDDNISNSILIDKGETQIFEVK
jgi:hypothetical protein